MQPMTLRPTDRVWDGPHPSVEDAMDAITSRLPGSPWSRDDDLGELLDIGVACADGRYWVHVPAAIGAVGAIVVALEYDANNQWAAPVGFTIHSLQAGLACSPQRHR